MGKGERSAPVNEISSESVRVEKKVYSVPELVKLHPGDPLFIKAFAGRDATNAFMSYHRRRFPHSRVKEAIETEHPDVKVADNEDFYELCERVNKVVPRLQSFAPWHYYLKVAFILGITYYLEFYMHYYAFYKWYLTSILGFFFAMIGMNIQHDANHGAISRNWWINRFLGYQLNWMGSSLISWIHQHDVQHHIHTNDINLDPDIEITDLYRLNPRGKIRKFYAFQHVYYFMLTLLYGWSKGIYCIIFNITGDEFTPVSEMTKKEMKFDMATLILFYFRWIVFPLWQVPSVWTILNILPMMIVAGQYLAFFFVLSHNFDGAHITKESRPGLTHHTFLYDQVTSSSNVGGKFLCFLNGGLNYQIEHHLFPRMSHCHYPKVAPIVREFCKEKNIPYVHFPTIYENLKSCVIRLYGLGTEPMPQSLIWNDSM